jgi:hypothetical protein
MPRVGKKQVFYLSGDVGSSAHLQTVCQRLQGVQSILEVFGFLDVIPLAVEEFTSAHNNSVPGLGDPLGHFRAVNFE